ncbi:PEP/pyruvate-binding domain-containing protein [Arthrobacter sp. D1-17]
MNALVLGLDAVSAGMLARVGGKAANLGELLSAGFPVPDGFCLTTDAYLQAVAPLGLDGVYRALQATPADDVATLAGLAGDARALITSAELPPVIAEAVRSAYEELGVDLPHVPVAVRSSATAEDLPLASFAGQQDTYLNVAGPEAVLDAVRNCWASLWTDRAVAYRADRRIDPSAVALAVVVQRMVDAAVAGVMFTANPVTGRRREAVIDASPGLGEAVVSGAVNPDHFVVEIASGQILQRRLGDKRILVRPLPEGGTERVDRTGAGAGQESSLTDAQLRGLAALGGRAEDHFGSPQDTEWAIDPAGKAWLTQSRPITTLYPLPERAPSTGKAPAEEGPRVFLCFSLAQGLTRPLTPMGIAAFRLFGSSVARAASFDVPNARAGPPPFAEAGQRIFIDLTAAARSSVGRRVVPKALDLMEARSAAVLRSVFEDPRFWVTRRTPWALVRRVGPLAVRARVPESLLRALLLPEAALRRVDRFTRDFSRALELPAGASSRHRLEHAEKVLAGAFLIAPSILPLPAVGFALLALAGKLLGGRERRGDLQPILRGLPNNITTEMDLDLWQLATELRADSEARRMFEEQPPAVLARKFTAGGLPATAESGLARFLERYGHRAVAEIDVGMPRWRDDPTHILGVLANYLRLEDPDLAPDRQFRRAEAEAEAQIARFVAEAASKGHFRGAVVRAALRRARLFIGLRERPKYQIVLALAEVRRQMAEVGKELAGLGRLARAEDVFFLTFADVERALDGSGMQDLVARRQGAYYLELERRHIPRMLLSDGTEPETLLSPTAGGQQPPGPQRTVPSPEAPLPPAP